jgi:soluble lytic murein transglycosylase-like protein
MTRESQWYRAEIEGAAKRYGIDPDLLEALVLTESSGLTSAYRFEPEFFKRYLAGKREWEGKNPRRVSASYGLCQVMWPVAVELGFIGEPEDLFSPIVGIEYGAKKLATELAWAHGNVDQALASYNGGRRGNEKRPYRNETYVNKVKANLLRVKHGSK